MAKLHQLEWETRAECLDAIASAFGEHPPREPIPAWWHEFEKWYQEQKKTAKDGVVSATLRTEAFYYDDEEEEDDEEDEPGDEPEDEPEDGERE